MSNVDLSLCMPLVSWQVGVLGLLGMVVRNRATVGTGTEGTRTGWIGVAAQWTAVAPWTAWDTTSIRVGMTAAHGRGTRLLRCVARRPWEETSCRGMEIGIRATVTAVVTVVTDAVTAGTGHGPALDVVAAIAAVEVAVEVRGGPAIGDPPGGVAAAAGADDPGSDGPIGVAGEAAVEVDEYAVRTTT